MDESIFLARADAALRALADALETHDAAGALEADLTDGVLTIELPGGQRIVVSRHAPSGQLWLASPLSGGLRFSPRAGGKIWTLADGRTLSGVLSEELQALAGIVCAF